jgi:hypothetical protein
MDKRIASELVTHAAAGARLFFRSGERVNLASRMSRRLNFKKAF